MVDLDSKSGCSNCIKAWRSVQQRELREEETECAAVDKRTDDGVVNDVGSSLLVVVVDNEEDNSVSCALRAC